MCSYIKYKPSSITKIERTIYSTKKKMESKKLSVLLWGVKNKNIEKQKPIFYFIVYQISIVHILYILYSLSIPWINNKLNQHAID